MCIRDRSTDAGAIFAATTAMMTIIMLTLHLLTEIGMLRGVITTLRWIIAAQSRMCRGLMRGLYRLPTQIRIVMTAAGTSAIIVIMFFLVRGTDGKMTEVKVARARNVVVKMPSAMRSVAMEVTKEQHNLTFQGAGDYLQGNDMIRLAGDLGIPPGRKCTAPGCHAGTGRCPCGTTPRAGAACSRAHAPFRRA